MEGETRGMEINGKHDSGDTNAWGRSKEKGGRGDSTRHRRKTVGLITRGNEAGE